jgi:phage terminase large subunit-like protein
VSQWDLIGRNCYLGIDIGNRRDMTALAAVFPPVQSGDPWIVLVWYWMPEPSIKEREALDKQPYQEWIDAGFISATQTYRTDPRVVLEKIKWCREFFEIVDIGYDPKDAYVLVQDLAAEEIFAEEVKQYHVTLHGPTEWLLNSYQDGEIWHANNPVLNFNAFSLAVSQNAQGAVKPMKNRKDETKHIDGISAVINAVYLALGKQEDKIVYNGMPDVTMGGANPQSAT